MEKVVTKRKEMKKNTDDACKTKPNNDHTNIILIPEINIKIIIIITIITCTVPIQNVPVWNSVLKDQIPNSVPSYVN